jgi:serine protease Do
MKLVKFAGIATVLMGMAALAIAFAPQVYGQSRPSYGSWLLAGPGSQIGASVRDLEGTEVRDGGGVYVEDVTPDSPAEKAGIRRADIVTKFDGENVRSVRQFTRLVQETPPGRVVSATVVRDGKSTDLKVTPEGGRGRFFIDGDRISADINERLRERFDQDFRDRLNRVPFDFDFGFDFPDVFGAGRLGVSVNELTPQLATYFGAKDGMLVTSVQNDSPASRAGIKAGDIITAINGQNIASFSDIMRSIRSVRTDDEVTIALVRDKKEISVKAKLDEMRARRPGRVGGIVTSR